jgi:hypothetical protein
MFLTGLALGLLAGAPLGFLLFSLVEVRKAKPARVREAIDSLHELTRVCLRLAHDCPHAPTKQGLREVAVELGDRAEELEKFHFESNGGGRASSRRRD